MEDYIFLNGVLAFLFTYFLISIYSLRSCFYSLSSKTFKDLDKNNKKIKRYQKLIEDKNKFNIKIIISESIMYGLMIIMIFFYMKYDVELLIFILYFVLLINFIKYFSYYLGIYKKEKNIYCFVNTVGFIFFIITPLYYIINFVFSLFCKIFIKNLGENVEEITEEEIKHMVEEVSESGLIELSKKEMISNIFDFRDKKVKDVMTHRTDVTAVDIDNCKKIDIINLALNEGFSRIPVYKDDIDNIIGILYVKDLLKLLINNKKEFSVKDFIREPFYIPETGNCGNLFDNLCLKKLQMAVVVDEYGGTSGIITMEDLLESIVGDIEDEYDDDEFNIKQIDEKIYIVDGGYDLLDFVIEYGLELDELDEDRKANTISGFIVSHTKKVPKNGENIEIKIGNATFNVLEVRDNKIKTIKIMFD